MAFFLFFQEPGNKTWQVANAVHRAEVEARNPEFITVLDVNNSFTPEPENPYACQYRGPFYIDLDAPSIEDAISDARLTIEAFKDMGVDLNTIEIFVSGGKGFHFTAPMPVFMDDKDRINMEKAGRGVTHLPLIYREMAMEHFRCNTLDMRVYSAKRGRMWRTPNVKRDNGMHKVRVTVQEVEEMTPESYRAIASQPRYMPPPASPTHPALKLSAAFASARDVVASRIKKLSKKKVDLSQLRKRWDGKFPPDIVAILSGEVQSMQGFQITALQVAISAVALGKTLEETLHEAEGLLKNHTGDSSRYGSYSQRYAALKHTYQYVEDNPGYQFSGAGIRSLLPDDYKRSEGDNEDSDASDGSGLYFNREGIFLNKDDEIATLSRLGFDRPRALMDPKNRGQIVGYDVAVFHHGQELGAKFLPITSLQSRQTLQKYAVDYSAAVHCTDAQVQALLEVFKLKSDTEDNNVLLVPYEGLILSKPDGAKTPEEWDVAWVTSDRVQSRLGLSYRFKSDDVTTEQHRSDLMQAGPLSGSPEEAENLEHLFNINSPYVVGAMVGWFAAAHARMLFDHFFKQFPLLQVFGQAGAGKTKTLNLMMYMHYFEVEKAPAAASTTTEWGAGFTCSTSASLPVVFDEYKPRESGRDGAKTKMLRDLFRNAYTRSAILKGTINRDGGRSQLSTRTTQYNAPVAFISEAIESQTAILERSVVVSFTKEGRSGREHHFNPLFQPKNRATLSRLGCSIVTSLIEGDWTRVEKAVTTNLATISEAWGSASGEGDDRQRFNVAVVLTGLDYVRGVLRQAHGNKFEQALLDLKEAVLHHSSSRTLSVVRKVQSEFAKVIATLAYLSKEPPREDFRVQISKDYTLQNNGTVDIKAQTCFDKYRAYCRHVGQEVLYDSLEAFITAAETYDGLVPGGGGDNEILRDGPRTKVYRIRLDKLASEDVDDFRG